MVPKLVAEISQIKILLTNLPGHLMVQICPPPPPHLVGYFSCIVLDREFGQWHFWLGIEGIAAMMIVAFLKECVVRSLERWRHNHKLPPRHSD